MSRPKPPQPVKLIVSILGADLQTTAHAIELMRQKFGDTDFISDALKFDFTDYYEPEMGTGLQRCMISFNRLIMPDELPAIKLATNEIEDAFTDTGGNRSLNIDPGYIALCHLILATGKAFTHRPYLGMGIYADITLVYRSGRFQTLEWTFPDYASPEMLNILTTLRERYFSQLQQEGKQCCRA